MKINSLILAVLSTTMLSVSTASAINVPCIVPDQPQLPASLDNSAQANSLKQATQAYTGDVRGFTQCVIDFAVANDATLTQADRDDLRAMVNQQTDLARTYSIEWNTLYGSYLDQNS